MTTGKTDREIYLNHAGTSWPKPRLVQDAVREAIVSTPSDWPQLFEQAHQAIAGFFGLSQPEQLLLTPGCTSALAIAIDDMLIADGQRILTTGWEHHAVHLPLMKRAASGLTMDYIPPIKSAADEACGMDLEWLERELSLRDVGLVAITAASNVTGELLPYEEVIRLAHEYGAIVLLDAAQIAGWLQLDLLNLGADLVTFGGHKGLQAPWGIGGLFVADDVAMECSSASCELPGAGIERKQPRPNYCDVGSVDQIALMGLRASIKQLCKEDLPAKLSNAQRQIARLKEMLDTIEGVTIYGPADTEQRMPTIAFKVEGASSTEIAAKLRDHSLMVGSGLQCAPLAHQTLGTEATGLVRISVGRYQTDNEIDQAIERLRSALKEFVKQ